MSARAMVWGCLLVLLLASAPAQALETIDHPDPEEFSNLVRTRLAEAIDQFEREREAGTLDSRAYGELAMTYDANDQVAPAAQAYQNAMELAPRDARWPYFLAQLAHKEGRFEEAERLYRKSLALNPDYVPTHIRLALNLIQKSELQEARELLEPIVQRHPGLAVAHAELGGVLLQLGAHQAALDHLHKALELQPSATRLYYQLGTALRALGRAEEAAEALGKAGDAELGFDDPLNEGMRRRSGSWLYWHNLAERTLATGDTATALLHLQRSAAANPDNIHPHATLARTLAESGRMPAALKLMRDYRARNPDEPLAAFVLGMLLASEEQDAEALEQFRIAHDGNPNLIELVIPAGHTAMRLEHYDEAQRWYARALELTPDALTVALHQVGAQYHAGDCRAAMDSAALLVPVAPENPDLLRTYARVAAACPEATDEERQNGFNAARNLYRLSTDPDTVDTLAVVEAARGNHQVADELLAQAIFQALRDGDGDEVETLRRRLDQVREHRLATSPWPQRHPLIYPPRPHSSAVAEVVADHAGQ